MWKLQKLLSSWPAQSLRTVTASDSLRKVSIKVPLTHVDYGLQDSLDVRWTDDVTPQIPPSRDG